MAAPKLPRVVALLPPPPPHDGPAATAPRHGLDAVAAEWRRLAGRRPRRARAEVEEGRKEKMMTCSPEASDGVFVGVGGEERRAGAGEDLIDVLQDDRRLADGLPVVDEHGNLVVDGVGLEEELALVLQVFLDVLVAQTLEAESKSRS
uniref:Uncharacterized protein n=1 Tax=Setaria italica TaxID=4555 RepID=K4AGB4_SETIT